MNCSLVSLVNPQIIPSAGTFSWQALACGNYCKNTPNAPVKQNTPYLHYAEQAQLVIRTISFSPTALLKLFSEGSFLLPPEENSAGRPSDTSLYKDRWSLTPHGDSKIQTVSTQQLECRVQDNYQISRLGLALPFLPSLAPLGLLQAGGLWWERDTVVLLFVGLSSSCLSFWPVSGPRGGEGEQRLRAGKGLPYAGTCFTWLWQVCDTGSFLGCVLCLCRGSPGACLLWSPGQA